MKNDNKGWLFWGFIGLVILNVILLAYIVVGLGGKDIRLAPSGPASACTDTDPNTLCTIGDAKGNTQVELWGSRIKDSDNGYLSIKTAATNGIKMTGIDWNNGGRDKPTNVLINGNLSIPPSIPGIAQFSVYSENRALEIKHGEIVMVDRIYGQSYDSTKSSSILSPGGIQLKNGMGLLISGNMGNGEVYVTQRGVGMIKITPIQNSRIKVKSNMITPEGVCFKEEERDASTTNSVLYSSISYLCGPNFNNNGVWTCSNTAC